METHIKDVGIIIPAAGLGRRMAGRENKLFLKLGNKTILEHTLDIFSNHPRIAFIVLTVALEDQQKIKTLTEHYPNIYWVIGGQERQDSVFNAVEFIAKLAQQPQWLLVHDGARPFCTCSLVDDIINAAGTSGAAIPVVRIKDTIRRVTDSQSTIVDRAQLFATQTPQGFATELLIRAYRQAAAEHHQATDDAALVEALGVKVTLVEGHEQNFKITTPQDLNFAQYWVNQTVQSV